MIRRGERRHPAAEILDMGGKDAQLGGLGAGVYAGAGRGGRIQQAIEQQADAGQDRALDLVEGAVEVGARGVRIHGASLWRRA